MISLAVDSLIANCIFKPGVWHILELYSLGALHCVYNKIAPEKGFS